MRNRNLIDIIDGYELIRYKGGEEILVRSPKGANFVISLEIAKSICSILLHDDQIGSHFNLPSSNYREHISKFDGSYAVNPNHLRQDRSLLAEIDEYSFLPTSLHGKDFIHIRRAGINFIMSIKVLFELVHRYVKGKLYSEKTS